MSGLFKRLTRLDAFPKLQRDLTAATTTGGLLSIAVLGLSLVLVITELSAFRSTLQKYEFLVDHTPATDLSLQINLDATVNMPCAYIRVDVLDLSGESLPVSDQLKAWPVEFTHKGSRNINSSSTAPNAKNENVQDHDDLQDVLKVAHKGYRHGDVAHRKVSQDQGACHVEGTFKVHKLTGMLHLTAHGHGHGGSHVPHDKINFTHRIDRLSFGPLYPGIKNPLDHTLETATTNFVNFQYFLAVVPTIYVDTTTWLFSKILLTNQYSVTEHRKVMDEERPDTFPGIFIKYTIEPISIRITAYRTGWVQFTTRVCGIIGGVYVTVGALYSFSRFISSRLSPSPAYSAVSTAPPAY